MADGFASTISSLYGSAGADWLDALPATIAACEAKWHLAALDPVDDLTYNYVCAAIRADGSEAILKLGVPGRNRNPEQYTEIEALRRFDGRGAVRLLAADPALGAMLLERALPGDTLATVADDEQATQIASGVMMRLWRPVDADHGFPTVERWGRGFERMRARFGEGTGPLPESLTSRAEGLFADLVASSTAPVLLHGDLHHWNILRATREPWLAIDPKGVVGEPAYEAGALMRNMVDLRLGSRHIATMLRRRLEILSDELHINHERLRNWAIAQAVLSAWWSIEDDTGTGNEAIRTAYLLERA
jgi:streptomycin 6-kinase